jgi:hypothetical protein
MFTADDGTHYVGNQRRLPRARVSVFYGSDGLLDGGGVYEYVSRTELFMDSEGQTRDIRLSGNVGFNGGELSPVSSGEFFTDGRERPPVYIGSDNRRAFVEEIFRDEAADAPGAACYDGYFIFQSMSLHE